MRTCTVPWIKLSSYHRNWCHSGLGHTSKQRPSSSYIIDKHNHHQLRSHAHSFSLSLPPFLPPPMPSSSPSPLSLHHLFFSLFHSLYLSLLLLKKIYVCSQLSGQYSLTQVSFGILSHSLAYSTGVTASWGLMSRWTHIMILQKAAQRTHGRLGSSIIIIYLHKGKY